MRYLFRLIGMMRQRYTTKKITRTVIDTFQGSRMVCIYSILVDHHFLPGESVLGSQAYLFLINGCCVC